MFRRISALIRNFFHRERLDYELEEELRSYVELAASEQTRGVADREAVLREVRREMGPLEPIKEGVRDIRTGAFLDILLQDLRYAFRTLGKNRSFSLVVVLTLALAIGANTTIFTIVNGVLLKPLPYPEPDRLFMLWETNLTDGTLGNVAPANFFDWREQTHSLARMAALDPYPDFILSSAGGPQLLEGAAVSHDFFSLLGVHMALGRDFTAEEDRPGEEHVVILSDATWRRYFKGDRGIIGKQVRLKDRDYVVAGVLPRGFSLPSKAADFQSRTHFEVWTPLALASPPEAWLRGTHPLCVFARLKPGVSFEQAQADLDHIARNLQRLYPDDDKERGIAVIPFKQHVIANFQTALIALLAAVGLVLLIACANIGNLLLTRASARQQEMSLRVALGAGTARLMRQLCTESMVLAFAGGLLGLTLAYAAVPILVEHLPKDLPRKTEIGVDAPVLAFTSLLCLATGILFGFAPLAQAKRSAMIASIKEGGRGVISTHSRVRSALVSAQVGMALVLLVGAGLMIKSFWELMKVPAGFQTERILTVRLSLPSAYLNGYKFGVGEHRRISAFQRELLERVQNIPGVQSAAFTAYVPLGGAQSSWAFTVEGRPPNPPGVYNLTNYRPVSNHYFETMGVSIVRGRSFKTPDKEDAPLVVIINESLARAFWPNQDAIGQRIRFGEPNWRTVVGIAADVHDDALSAKPQPEMYIPYAQVANVEARPILIVRAIAEPLSFVRPLRKAIAEVDPNVPADQIETMKQIVSASVSQSRFRTAVLFVFALLALFVAALGLYGVMNYFVTQRMPEFGVRMAVGASSGAVLRLVLTNAAKLAGIGIGLGLLGATVLTRFISSLLYGVTAFDVATVLSASIFLAAVAMAASYIPALRAARSDPLKCLRYE